MGVALPKKGGGGGGINNSVVLFKLVHSHALPGN